MNQRHQDELTQYHFNIETEDIERIFETLLRELRPLIFRKIGYITSNQFDIEDMYQEIIIKMYRALQHYDFSRAIPFKRYLYFLIRSVKYDYLRKSRAESHRHVMLINEYVVDYHCSLALDEVERSFLREELSKEIMSQAFTLSGLERDVLKLIIKEYKPREIAQALEIKDKDVYNAIQRCKMKMKRQLRK
ncbi:sigma-70 family RNA polymerase sigma factor [Listeria monocytogenes]|uniref:sigma-70 family RNA polymerase sigma factor n=1 Tax=Listeria monocytogenes TaxID=1639 RepID=UPI000BDF45B0|nr:RNA polymerase sigma factor [Listeria monocytogenes]PCX03614.1 RNA polymerase subunit sigma [Listeria monocytogenes]